MKATKRTATLTATLTALLSLQLSACSGATSAVPQADLAPKETAAPAPVEPSTPGQWLAAIASSSTPPEVRNGRIAQCNRLIEVISHNQSSVRHKDASNAKEMQALAVRLRSFAEQVKEVPIEHPHLVEYRQEYVEILTNFAKTSERIAQAMTSKDLEALQAARQELSYVDQHESELVVDINHHCDSKNRKVPAYPQEIRRAASACSRANQEQCVRALDGYLRADDGVKSVKLAEQLCLYGSIDACQLAGWLHQEGEYGLKADLKRSLPWAARACRDGSASGCYRAALYFEAHPEKVNGVSGSDLLFARACAGYRIDACIKLEQAHKSGWRAEQASVRAPLKKACDSGLARACRILSP